MRKSSEENLSLSPEHPKPLLDRHTPFGFYPLFLYLVTNAITYGAYGTFIMSGTFLAEIPDLVRCNGSDAPYTRMDGYCENASFHATCEINDYTFSENWTSGTIASKYDLICDRKTLINDMNTVGLAGLLVGSLLFGTLSDMYGRQRIMIISSVLAGLSGFITTYIATYTFLGFVIGRFFMFGCVHGSSIVSFVYTMEILSPKLRAPFGIMVNIFGAFGFMTLTLIPHFSSRWEVMSWVISCYPLFIIFLAPFIPESFKWNFSKGNIKAGKKTYLEFCRRCSYSVDERTLQGIVTENTFTDTKVYTMADLRNSRELKYITLKNAFTWFSLLQSYYVLSLGRLPGSLLQNNLINGCMEMAIIPVALISGKSWAKRSTLATGFFVSSGVILMICGALELFSDNDQAQDAIRMLSFVGRAIVSVNVAWMYIYSAELYPTVIRNCGVGFCTLSGRVGAMIGQQLYKLVIYYTWLPCTIVGLTGLAAGVCSWSMPETIQAPLFQSIEEAEEFYRSKSKYRKTSNT